MVQYTFDGYRPYGAGDMFCIDAWLPDHFEGNAIEYLLSDGFSLYEESDCAYLVDLKTGAAIAELVKD